jgi:hypothetical protein
VRACCFRFLCSTNAAATMAAMQHSETTAAMITAEFPAPPSAVGASVYALVGRFRARASKAGDAACHHSRLCGRGEGGRGPQSRKRRSSALPAEGALRLL